MEIKSKERENKKEMKSQEQREKNKGVARVLKWVAMPSSTGSSRPRDPTWISHIAGRFFTI